MEVIIEGGIPMRQQPTAEVIQIGLSDLPSKCEKPGRAMNCAYLAVFAKARRVAALAVIAFGVASAVGAERAAAETVSSSLNQVISRGKLIIGTRSTAVPFSFKDSGGALVGFDIDLARELAKGLLKDPAKVEFTILTGSADRVAALQAGRVDAVISAFSVYLERVQVVDFSVPYVISDNVFIVKKDSPVMKVTDVQGKTIVTRQGADIESIIKRMVQNPSIQGYPEIGDAFLAFRQGRGDVFFYESAAALYYARQYPDQFRAVAAPDPGTAASPISIGVKKGDQNWLNYLNWALYDLKASGKLHELHVKWFGNDSLEPNWVRQPL